MILVHIATAEDGLRNVLMRYNSTMYKFSLPQQQPIIVRFFAGVLGEEF